MEGKDRAKHRRSMLLSTADQHAAVKTALTMPTETGPPVTFQGVRFWRWASSRSRVVFCVRAHRGNGAILTAIDTPLQQRVREVEALTQSRDHDVDRAGSGVEVAVAVAVAPVRPRGADLAVAGAAHRVSVGRQATC